MSPEEQAVRAYWKAKNASIAIDGAHYEHSDSFSRFANDAMRFVNDAIQAETASLRESAQKWMAIADAEATKSAALLEVLRRALHLHDALQPINWNEIRAALASALPENQK